MQTLAEVGSQGEVVDLNSVTEATLSQDGQIILTSEDGHGKHTTYQYASTNIIYACDSVHNNFHCLICCHICACLIYFVWLISLYNDEYSDVYIRVSLCFKYIQQHA